MEVAKAKSVEFRAKAAACLAKAESMPESADRSLMIDEALSWLQLAAEAEKTYRAKAPAK